MVIRDSFNEDVNKINEEQNNNDLLPLLPKSGRYFNSQINLIQKIKEEKLQ